MFCNKCGQELPDKALFCFRCGEKIKDVSSDVRELTSPETNNVINAKSIICPHCGGAIEPMDGIDSYYCPSCGNKIIIEGLSDVAYEAKTRVREMQHQKTMQETRYRNERERWERNKAAKEKEARSENRSNLVLYVIFALLLILAISYLGVSCYKHSARIKDMEKISLEIEEAMDEKDYEKALRLCNRLRLNDGWSDEDTEEWDERREEYMRQIEQAQREFGSVRAPYNSADCIKYSVSDLKDKFVDSGFEKVSTQEDCESSTFRIRSLKVTKVTINGKDSFDTREAFDKDSEVIIYYS